MTPHVPEKTIEGLHLVVTYTVWLLAVMSVIRVPKSWTSLVCFDGLNR